MVADNTPVIVGVAQILQKEADWRAAKEPLALMIDAAKDAAEDAGAGKALIDKISSVRAIRGVWPYKNPAAVVAEALGLSNAETGLTPYGGNFVQTATNVSCLDILAGKHEAILISGGECGYSTAKARKDGERPTWQKAPGAPSLFIGEDVPMSNAEEEARGLRQPIQIYPMMELALRHHLGESPQEHLKRISELWAGFSKVASGNPHAWIRDAVSAEEIRTPSATNRAISYPYTKFMNSNSGVDMSAGIILTSAGLARKLGIAEDKWVYPWAGTDAHDTYCVSNRDNLYTSPAMRFAGGRVLELTGLSTGDLDHVDLYSCFPVAVQIAANELGLDQQRPLTVTGGLTFNGGPLNDYVMHSISTMVEILRREPGKKGLITANGGFITKHAFGIYSTEPPSKPFQHEDVQQRVDQEPTREVVGSYAGEVTVEAYSVMYGANGPDTAFAAVLTPTGQRAWAVNKDADVMQAMTTEEFCGRSATLAADGSLTF